MKHTRSEYPLTAVKRGISGLGLFACETIQKGTTIIEYTGEKISADEANRRGGQYLFEMTDEWTIDGKGRDNTARYINHSCAPNAEAELDEEALRVFINAKRTIKTGEEITYNYGKEFFTMYIKPKGCKCAKCIKKNADIATT